MPDKLLAWIDRELAEASLMTEEGSYDGEDYWRGVYSTLTVLKKKINSGEIDVT